MSETKLEPCPFCDAPMEQHPKYPNEWRHSYRQGMECPAALAVVYLTHPLSITAWNRRAAHADRDGVLEEAATAVESEYYRDEQGERAAQIIRRLKSTTEDSHDH